MNLPLFLGRSLFIGTVILLGAPEQSGAGQNTIPTGLGKIEVGAGTNPVTVFTYKPRNYAGGPLLVVCHGMSRNAEKYCADAIPLAERDKVLIAAPLFDLEHFHREDYNLGGVVKNGKVQPRENWTYQRLNDVVEAVRREEGRPDMPYYLIGHSAGGQFLMRYAALMPGGPQRIVAANPGSDLFPRRDWKFGYGFGGLPKELSDDEALKRYLAAPLTIYLGLADIDPQHPELDRSVAAEAEGRYRLERGRACYAFAQRLAQARGWQFNWTKVEVPGVAHVASGMLKAKEVDRALFPGGMPAAQAFR